MNTAGMIRMANQIAGFYRSYPHDEAVKETADHINRFWAPRMRRAFLEHMARGGEGFGQPVKDAAAFVRKPAAEAA